MTWPSHVQPVRLVNIITLPYPIVLVQGQVCNKHITLTFVTKSRPYCVWVAIRVVWCIYDEWMGSTVVNVSCCRLSLTSHEPILVIIHIHYLQALKMLQHRIHHSKVCLVHFNQNTPIPHDHYGARMSGVLYLGTVQPRPPPPTFPSKGCSGIFKILVNKNTKNRKAKLTYNLPYQRHFVIHFLISRVFVTPSPHYPF